MTPAEICSLGQASLDKVQALKQKFDAAFEILAVSGSKEDLQKVESLQQQIDDELQSPLIARSPQQISNKTLVYIGALQPGILHKLPKTLEHMYTSFPDGELQRKSLQIGGKTSEELQELMRKSGFKVGVYAKDIMNSPSFLAGKQSEQADLIKLRVSDLGLSDSPTTNEIHRRIAELGLELCPPEVASYYRLAYLDQPVDDLVYIGMKPVRDEDGDRVVFSVGHSPDPHVLWLGVDKNDLDDVWHPGAQLLFRVRREE